MAEAVRDGNRVTSILARNIVGLQPIVIDGGTLGGINYLYVSPISGGGVAGSVDVSSVIPGTGPTNLGKAIDTPAGATDVGVAALAVRDDVLTTLTPIDGDWVPLRTDQYGDTWVSMGTRLDSTNDSVTADTELPAAVALSDTLTNPTAPAVGSYGMIYNGSTWERARSVVPLGDNVSTGVGAMGNFFFNGASGWDRVRSNYASTLLTSAARTSTNQSADQTNNNSTGLLIIVSVTSAGTGSITPSLQVKDSISSNYFSYWTATTAITSTATFAYFFRAGASGGSFTEAVALGLPAKVWRLNVTHNNANSITYSVSAVNLM